MMDQYRVNQTSRSYSINNVHSSGYYTSVPSSPQNVSKSGTKAYINPQIVNYEYIKRSLTSGSLPATNKIHLNPNFKGNGVRDVQIRNTRIVPGTVSLNSSPTSGGEFQHDSPATLSVVEGGRSDTERTTLMCSVKTNTNKSVSRFKKVNYPSEQSECKYNKYTWSRDKHKNKYCLNKKGQGSSVDNVLVTRKDNSWSNVKPETIILPASAYKYTAPKKISKVMNSSASTFPNDKTSLIHPPKMKIINKSRTKLINNISPKTKPNFKSKINQTPIKRNSVTSKFVYIKNIKSPTIKLASSVRNKYKYCKTARQLKSLKYKIDKRKKIPESTRKRMHIDEMSEIWKLFPRNYYDKRKLGFVNSYFFNHYEHYLSCRKTHSWRRDQKAKVINHRKQNHYPNKRVVKIGGILYKSTTNKLTLANNGKQLTGSKEIDTGGKGKKNYVLYVRGEKFILDKNGKTLRRQISHKEKDKNYLTSLKRIYLGGVTYVQKSDGVLIRTNVHQARNLVNQAKHKSIAVLSQLKKRSSLPCMIFHRFGKCNRHNKGLCIYKHDQKNVAICKKFLKGNCDNSNCLLSHEVIQEKMATCHFFLKGFCTRENCPFLHVKLNKNAAICEKFLQGFCDSGKNCTKRHLYQCPEFDKSGKCSQGSKCHYPHKTVDKSKDLIKNTCQTQSKSKGGKAIQYHTKSLDSLAKKRDGKESLVKRKDGQNKRELKKVRKTKRKSSQPSTSVCDQLNSTIECVPKRIKLDKLPCYIPLKSDQP